MNIKRRFNPKRSMQVRRIGRAESYYWVTGTNPENFSMVVMGAYNSENEANDVSQRLQDGVVHELNTRDKARATQVLKHKLFKDGKSIEQALKHASHKMPENNNRSDFDNDEQERYTPRNSNHSLGF